MELRLDEDQEALGEAVRRFCADRLPLDGIGVRELRPVDRTLWKELAGLGVFDVVDLGTVEAAVVFEQLGAHLAPGPTVWTTLARPFVPGITTGDQVVAGIDLSVLTAGTSAGHEAVPLAEGTGPVLVEHAGDIDGLVVLQADEAWLIDGGELPEVEVLVPFDPLTPVGRFAELPAGERVGGAAEAERMRLVGTVLTAAVLLGVADRAMDVARGYALERHQFGVPIGSFQAVKHMLADMYVRTVLARSSVYAAAATLDDPTIGDAERAARGAKLLAGEAARENAGTAIQVLGGMGFTWEMLPNHLLKRAWVLDQSFGTADDHALALALALGTGLGR
jgi:alkylation response protein AidB-like acyl-CoA dehydrogenase